jgi:glycosyltransferase involved in cell wall biosynthesis
MKVLHILTLTGKAGEYGGPNQVARNQCFELLKRQCEVTIVSGYLENSAPSVTPIINEKFEKVQQITKKFPYSALYSLKIFRRLLLEIRRNQIVHIHFARDLIPMSAAAMCLLLKKPYITQTHGMVVPKDSPCISLIDVLLTKPLMRRAQINFALTPQEEKSLKYFCNSSQLKILPNGVRNDYAINWIPSNDVKRIAFCSRIHERKRPDRFLEIAKKCFEFNDSFDFYIYGPDGGILKDIKIEIEEDEKLAKVQYAGALLPSEVAEQLMNSNVIVLLSDKEPFPMVILESMSVGTPVMVYRDCEISASLRKFDPDLVVEEIDFELIRLQLIRLAEKSTKIEYRNALNSFCSSEFGMGLVTDTLIESYAGILRTS